MAVWAGAGALAGGWAGFGVALARTSRPLSPQACVAMGVLVCFAAACAIRELRARRARAVGVARETSCETTVSAGGGESS